MPGPFDYNPTVQDNRAQIALSVAPAIREDFATVGAAIKNAEQQHKQLKAKKALADIYAGQMGVEPEQVDKLPAAKLDAFLMTAPGMIDQRRQQQQAAVLGNALRGFVTSQRPQTNFNAPPMGQTYMGMMGDPASRVTSGPPGMNRQDALASALAGALQGGANADTLKAFSSLARVLTQGGGLGRDSASGLMTWDGKPLPAATQKLLGGPGAAGAAPGFNFTAGPGGTEFWNFGTRGGQVRETPTTRPESFGMGPYPADSTPPAGVPIVKLKDGTYYIVGRGAGLGTQAGQIVDSTLGGNGSNGGTPAAGNGASEANLMTDSKGQKWKYTGSMSDPKQDKDESHWQLVTQ